MSFFSDLVALCERHGLSSDREIPRSLLAIGCRLDVLTEKVIIMSGTLDTGLATLTSDVAALTTAVDSADALITGLASQLAAAIAAAGSAGATPAQLASLQTLHTSLVSETGALSAAVAAGTPTHATPTPTPVPVTSGTTPNVTGSGSSYSTSP